MPCARGSADSISSAPAADKIERLLLAVVAELRQIRHLLAQDRRPASTLTRADRTFLARLLPPIAGVLGSEEFTSRDLATDAAPALRLVLRGLSVKQIGKLLARADGVPIGGWMLERRGIEINVTLWRVVAVSNRFETGTGVSRSGAIDAGAPNA